MSKKKWEKRRYQERTIENFCKWKNTDSKLSTIILPTGAGKSFTMSMCLDNVSGSKILWVAHREELIDQAYDTLSNVISWTNNIQKEIAEHKADPSSDIIVGSVQTLARKRKHLTGFEPDFIIIDEYHHRSEKNVTYQGLLDRFPKAKVIGLTATPWRFSGDTLPLGEVLFEMDIGTSISHNYLVPAIPEILKSNTSLANVKTRMGDFSTKELSEAINVEERNKLIAKRVIELVKEGRQGILFGVDVAHAHDMYELLKNDIRAAEIYGDTPKEERRHLMEKIRNGETDCLFNNLISVEGFDVPHLSFAVIARPTKSLSLFTQMVGRVLRIFPGKKDAIIVDVYDKLKVKQSRITFNDVAYNGDMYGERKRANNILTADIEWKQPDAPGGGKPDAKSDQVAKALNNFPVFMVHKEDERWITDETFLPITSWVIANDQRLITWTEEKLVQRLVEKKIWKPLKTKPTKTLIKQFPIMVKHEVYGMGQIVDIGFGLEVKVQFGSDGWMSGKQEFVSIDKLKVAQTINEFAPQRDRIKVDRVFYICFPSGVDKGRVVELTKEKKDLMLVKDQRMTITEARGYIVGVAQQAGVLPLVRSDAKWKKSPISISQKQFITNMIMSGKVRFDIDIDTMNKGDASAIIEQVKWQKIIHQKFGSMSKDKLLGYDSSVEDV
jgi:superfamily II DNA or RNA helicase